MDLTVDFLDKLIPITHFNRGQASKIFERVKKDRELVVLKNNQPSAVILSIEEYRRLSDIAEDYALLIEASKRMTSNSEKNGISEKETNVIWNNRRRFGKNGGTYYGD